MIFIGRGLPSSFRGGFATAWTVVFVIILITSYQRCVIILRMSSIIGTFSLLEFYVLLHQLMDIGCSSSNLLSHHGRVHRWWWSESVHMSRLTSLVEIRWLARENFNSIVPHRQCQIDEAEKCSSSICFLAYQYVPRHWYGQSSVPISKRQCKRAPGVSGEPMMSKSIYLLEKQNNVRCSLSIMYQSPYLLFVVCLI